MGYTATKLAPLLGVVFSFGVALTPLGCDETLDAVPPPASPPSREYKNPEAPPGVEAALTACADEGVGRLKEKNYAVLFNVKATSEGHVESVAVRDSILGDEGIESCMVRVLSS